MKLKVEVDIPDGDYCFDKENPGNECRYLQSQYCMLFLRLRPYLFGRVLKCLECINENL